MSTSKPKVTLPHTVSLKDVRRLLQPVVVGGDILAYSYVREFHRAYGISHTIVLATQDIKMLSSSKLSDYRLEPGIHQAEELYEALERTANEFRASSPERILLVVGCDDCHARMLSEEKERLQAAGYVVPYPDFELLDHLTQKRHFYELCEELDIPFPTTWYINCHTACDELLPDNLSFPLIGKPSNSALFQEADVAMKRKIYEIDSLDELKKISQTLRASNYEGEFVLQDFIPGADDAIRTLTTFSNAKGDVRVVSGGVVCLQDHDPTALGNPVCILGKREKEIITCAKRFVKRTGYRGFANFDIKYDERDGSFRFFEVNVRAGRNSYYLSLGGVNFTTLLVDEFIRGVEIPYNEAFQEFAYCCVPNYVLRKSMPNKKRLNEVLATRRNTRNGYPLYYGTDSLVHNIWALLMYINQVPKFKRFYWDTHGKQLKG